MTTTAIVGFGTVGTALATLFARAGVPASVANSRGGTSIVLPDALRETITPVDLGEAIRADVVVAAVPFASMKELGAAVDSWDGRIVVDVTNAFGVEPESLAGRSSAEVNADLFPGARFVRGLNHLPYDVYLTDTPGSGGRYTAFLSGDDADANAVVAGLAEEIGLAPIDVGPLAVGGPLLAIGGPLLMKRLVQYAS